MEFEPASEIFKGRKHSGLCHVAKDMVHTYSYHSRRWTRGYLLLVILLNSIISISFITHLFLDCRTLALLGGQWVSVSGIRCFG